MGDPAKLHSAVVLGRVFGRSHVDDKSVLRWSDEMAARFHIRAKHEELGGDTGFLGKPLMPVMGILPGIFLQHFAGGTIYWKSDIGAHEIHGDIRDKYVLGAWGVRIGYPTTDELWLENGRVRYNDFEFGTIYWLDGQGAHVLLGDIRGKWREIGVQRIGYPVSDEQPTSDGIGRFTECEAGAIYWHPNFGAFASWGLILDTWRSAGAEAGRLGYPQSDPEPAAEPGVMVQRFQRGFIRIRSGVGAEIEYDRRIITASTMNALTGSADATLGICADGTYSFVGEYREHGYLPNHVVVQVKSQHDDGNGRPFEMHKGFVSTAQPFTSGPEHWQQDGYEDWVRDNWDWLCQDGFEFHLHVATDGSALPLILLEAAALAAVGAYCYWTGGKITVNRGESQGGMPGDDRQGDAGISFTCTREFGGQQQEGEPAEEPAQADSGQDTDFAVP